MATDGEKPADITMKEMCVEDKSQTINAVLKNLTSEPCSLQANGGNVEPVKVLIPQEVIVVAAPRKTCQ